jgi:uncharacterized protein YndB with AHSA1/START domain
MVPEFTVWIHVSRTPAEVFEAVADPAILSRYFTTAGADKRLDAPGPVQWEFADFPGPFTVQAVEARSPERIVIDWPQQDDPAASTRVTFTFEPVESGTRTKVSVSETGWPMTEAGLAASYGNCMGWSQMLAALKLWVEHGINLRAGAYK